MPPRHSASPCHRRSSLVPMRSSNGPRRRQPLISRVRLWKRELQKLANELGLDIMVSRLPPGTSKWNKIEHRLFSFISQNWRAKPLVSYRVIVELISATTTKTGLTVHCELDTGQYPSGIVVSDADMAAINIKRAEFHGEWNYTISPNDQPPNRALIL
jgi:Rhodopirellula transposase DDE domain